MEKSNVGSLIAKKSLQKKALKEACAEATKAFMEILEAADVDGYHGDENSVMFVVGTNLSEFKRALNEANFACDYDEITGYTLSKKYPEVARALRESLDVDSVCGIVSNISPIDAVQPAEMKEGLLGLYKKYYVVSCNEHINENEHYTLPDASIIVSAADYKRDPEGWERKAEEKFCKKNGFEFRHIEKDPNSIYGMDYDAFYKDGEYGGSFDIDIEVVFK